MTWPTPDTQNDREGANLRAEAKGSHAVSLHHKVAMWATPQTADDNMSRTTDPEYAQRWKDRPKSGSNLAIDTALWQAPASDSGERKDEQGLDQQARWMTPTSRDWKDGSDPSENVPTNGLLVVQAVRSHPAPATLPPGDESSPPDPTSPRRSLNPRFVEWLMNWEPGWTSLAPLGSASRETE
jgi:DNA (cytosine-5)-methyltransferase 1